MFFAGMQRSVGMVDDVRRVAQPWPFDLEQIVASIPVFVWHAGGDRQVPVAPWCNVDGVHFTVLPGAAHEISQAAWGDALRSVTTP